jgi:uncharacterized OB-fold protein
VSDALTLPPQPAPDADTEAFWQATAEGRLALCRCESCDVWIHPPLERCRRCDQPTTFADIAGTGEVHSFIIVRQPSVPGYFDAVPYVVGVVELDEQEGLRLPGRIVGIEPEGVMIGMPVRADLVPLDGGDFTVAVFRPA